MVRPIPNAESQLVETWESTIEGTTWVSTYNRREDRYVKTRVGGREGSRRLRITRDDRKYNQEQIPDENKMLDPFTNGALRLMDTKDADETLDLRYHYTDAQIAEMFEVRDEKLFTELVTDIESELIIRRMMALGETAGTVQQGEILREYAGEKWPIGGTQKAVREMIEAGERIGANRIY